MLNAHCHSSMSSVNSQLTFICYVLLLSLVKYIRLVINIKPQETRDCPTLLALCVLSAALAAANGDDGGIMVDSRVTQLGDHRQRSVCLTQHYAVYATQSMPSVSAAIAAAESLSASVSSTVPFGRASMKALAQGNIVWHCVRYSSMISCVTCPNSPRRSNSSTSIQFCTDIWSYLHRHLPHKNYAQMHVQHACFKSQQQTKVKSSTNIWWRQEHYRDRALVELRGQICSHSHTFALSRLIKIIHHLRS